METLFSLFLEPLLRFLVAVIALGAWFLVALYKDKRFAARRVKRLSKLITKCEPLVEVPEVSLEAKQCLSRAKKALRESIEEHLRSGDYDSLHNAVSEARREVKRAKLLARREQRLSRWRNRLFGRFESKPMQTT